MAQGSVNKFGSHAGAAVDTVIIAATPVTGQRALFSEFGATMDDSGADGQFRLQVSNDAFASDIRTKSRIVMPVGGSHIKTFNSPIKVNPGESFRVIFSQVVLAPVSAEVFGVTDTFDIMD